jgi:hypothetical protein
VNEKETVKICSRNATFEKRRIAERRWDELWRDLEGIRPLPFPSVMLQV